MVTWSVAYAGLSSQHSEYFCAGTSSSEDAANYAALSFVGSLIPDVPGDTPYWVIIGTQDAYIVTVEEARNTVISALANVLDVFATMEALRQLRAAGEV